MSREVDSGPRESAPTGHRGGERARRSAPGCSIVHEVADDGHELARRLTAARDLETVQAAVAHGVVHYLIKPFSFATFRDRLERYAAYRGRLEHGSESDQDGVDALLGALRGSAAAALPKGLSAGTYDVVRDALRRASGPLAAHEVAASPGLSRVTARRYLDHMAREGAASQTLRYGGAGRPEHRYEWVADRAGSRRARTPS